MSHETRAETRRRVETGSWADVLRYEAERRLRISFVIAVGLSLFGLLFVWIGPQIVSTGNVDQIAESLPPAMRELLGFESLASIAGLLASEFYSLGWLVGLGAYVAYTAASRVGGDVESDRMDLLLAAPVSRSAVLLGTYLALLVPILVANVVVPAALYAGSVIVGEPLPLDALVALHALSVPYLLCWGAVGVLLGVRLKRGRTAGRVALGIVFASWLLESLVVGTDFEWLSDLSPVHYLQPPEVLVHGTYDLTGAGLLFGAAAVVFLLARASFARADL